MKETRSAYVAVALLVALSGVAQAMYVWPYPETFAPGTYSEGVDPSQFAITTNSSSALLGRAIERYQTSILFPFGAGTPVSSSGTVLVSLEILVGDDSEELQLGVDESYTLQILNPSTSATVTAQTVWGALRGLETFSQVVDWSDYTSQYSVNVLPLYVNDAPRFPWRGLLIDTARHFLLPSTIYRTIDAMSYNKFNTLHWHAVDAESFPVVSDTFPDLTDGAWFPTATYSHDFILDIVSYAKDRGIRVVPEFDIPGHAYSWGAGYPNITTDCPDYDSNINNVPLDPTIDFTWDVLSGFIPEMAELFDDKCFHVGGDEVIYSCWNDDPSVVSWMQEHSTDAKGLLQYFEDNLAPIITGANKTAVVWEDLFDNGIQLDSSYIVEVWSEADTLQELINAGFRSISAYGYYLNDQEPLGQDVSEWVDTWQVFYGHDVMDGLTGSSATLDLVLGGEAAMWGEQVDSVNYDSRVWPRACGVIERLWSPSYVTDVDSATTRLIEHRCRLARRGIGAGPVSPDYCSIPYTPYSCNGPTSADATVIGHK